MARIFLLRHAHSTANSKGILAGRTPNITLSKEGIGQLENLALRFAGAKFDQVISSPIQRCIETISFFENRPLLVDSFQEVDYGNWTGKKVSSLARNKDWRKIYTTPASVRFPNGETLPEVQTRALHGLDMHVKSKAKNVLIVTHADVIKVLLLHALGTHLNNIDKIQISNASISVIDQEKDDLRVFKVNDEASKISDLLK